MAAPPPAPYGPSPYGPPPYGPPPRPLAWQSPGVLAAIVFAIVLAVGVFVFLTVGLGLGLSGFPVLIFAPFCAFILMVVVLVGLGVSRGSMVTRIPPPPPIQQPMVPAGQAGPVALNCPNCGAPPQNVDRFGVATCTYCNTRFLVR